jgi:uncharacterized damage-inducible protein DinB
MSTALADLFRYNQWANLALLDACAPLPPESLDASLPGIRRNVRDEWMNLVSSEQFYAAGIVEQWPEVWLREVEDQGWPGYPALREAIVWSAGHLIESARRLDEPEPREGVREPFKWRVTTGIFQIQCLSHSAEHRARISAVLAAQGHAMPNLEGWTYERAIRPPRPPKE